MSDPKIVLVGGGSGGHITPILSLAHELKKAAPNCQLIYIGHKGDSFDSLKASSSDIDFSAFINGGKFRRYHSKSLFAQIIDLRTWLLNIRDLFRTLTAVVSAWRILSRLKPDLVFSKGGFVAVPVGLVAHLKGIPIVTHDSDAAAGLANRIVGRWAKLHATGMPVEHYSYSPDSSVYVGVPVSSAVKPLTLADQKAAKKRLGLNDDSLILLLTGGGNGSLPLNNLLVAAAPTLLSTFGKLELLHVAGQGHEDAVRRQYNASLSPEQLSRVHLFGFSANMPELTAAADLVVSRAGATIIEELAIQGKACVIIPSQYLSAGHQLKNAEALKEQAAAVVLNDEVSQPDFTAAIGELLGDEPRRRALATKIKSIARPDAAQKLANILLKVAAGKDS